MEQIIGDLAMLVSAPSDRRFFFVRSAVIALLAATVSLAGCGGGGSSTPPPPAPDFTISAAPSSLSLQQEGTGTQLTISIIPANGFTGSVTITFPNLPTGISVAAEGFSSGPPFVASPSAPLFVGVSASGAAALGNGAITVQGTSGSLKHSMTVSTAVTAAIAFQLSVSPSTVTIGPNGQASAQVTLVPGSNFGSNSVSLNFSSVSIGNSGVDMSLSSQSLTAAKPQATVIFQSGFAVKTGSFPVPLTGTLGAQVVNLPLTLNVTNPAQACTGLSRSTEQPTEMSPTGVVYDPVSKLVFAAVEQTNTVDAFSSTTAQKVATIPIPAPLQLDVSPDGSRILVGTYTNYMDWVDPVSFQVVGRVPVPSALDVGNLGISAPGAQPIILASGKVLVSFDGSAPQLWDPVTNAWSDPTPSGFGSSNSLMRRSADHSKVVVVTGNGLAVFDSAQDSYGPVQNLPASAAALNSDGSKLAVLAPSSTLPGGDQVTLYDSNFHVLANYQLNSNSVEISSMDDVIFSRDDSILFVREGDIAAALSTTDLSFIGLAPNTGSGGVGNSSDIDESNVIFSPGAGTAAFTDAGSPCALGTDQPVNMALSPPQGPVNAPSPVTLTAATGITAESQVYFGAAPGSSQATPGTNLSASPPTSIQVTPPQAPAAGAVNVTVTNPDGWVAIAPEAFSFGSSVLGARTTSGPATGGTSVTLFGYGLDFDPGQIQVTVGGSPGTVTRAFAGQRISFDYPIDQVTFTTPAGKPGAADVVVTTPAGTATLAGGFHYLQSAQSYSASGTLTEVVYDPSRQRLYAADGGSNAVDVFDLSKQQFLAPIAVGNAPQALALTPDLNTLVVSNGADATVSIVDMTGVNPTRTVSVGSLPNPPPQCGQPIPYAVATTSNAEAVIALTCPNVTAGDLIVLDLATQAVGCGTSQGCNAMMAAFPESVDQVLAVSGTSDGSAILLWNGVTFGRWDAGADTFKAQGSGNDLLKDPVVQTAAADDGTAFSLGYGVVDPTLNLFSMMQDVDYLNAGLNDSDRLPGEKLHPSGALLYFPDTDGFSIYDVHRGRLTDRVTLPQQTALTFDAMAIDDTGSRVFLLTTTGLTVVNIADLPLSIGNVQPALGSASGGTTVVVRGSGFENGAQVLFNNEPAGVAFVDGSTLKVTSPAVSAGAVRITVVNPNGSQYSLDDSFTAQ